MAKAKSIIDRELKRSPVSRIVQFGDVVENVNSNAKDPLEQGIERYVGLDHLNSDSLRIERWGNVSEGTTFTRRFAPNHVLFGKRRAYQRKAAVADFEGVCSGDILVFEAKGELIPELLPFIVSSDSFFEYALRTSAGSLSPRTRWSDLAKYEFVLPPKPEQYRISAVLESIMAKVQTTAKVIDSLESVIGATAQKGTMVQAVNPLTGRIIAPLPEGWSVQRGDEIFEASSGNGEPKTFADAGDTLFFKVADFNLNPNPLNLREAASRFDRESAKQLKVYHSGTVVFPKRGASVLMNKAGVMSVSAALDPNVMALTVRQDVLNPHYLYWMIKSIRLGRFADTTSLPQLNHKHLDPLLLPLPPLAWQTRIVHQLEQLVDMVNAFRRLQQKESSMLKTARQQLLSGSRVV